MAEMHLKVRTLRGGMKALAFGFALSALLAFLALTFTGHYAALLPLLFLYFGASVFVAIIYLPAIHFVNSKSGVAYILSVVLSLFVMIGYQGWLSGNSFSHTLQACIQNRADGFGMADPYVVTHIVTFVLILRGYFER